MAKYPYRELGIQLERKYRSDLNDNFKDIESDIKEQNTANQDFYKAQTERQTNYEKGVDNKLLNQDTQIAGTDKRIDNIIAQSGTSSTEVVDMRLGADGDVRTTAGELLREVHEQVIQSDRQTQTLTHGTQVINAESGVASPMKVEFYGVTRVNLLGNDGNFEKDRSNFGNAVGGMGSPISSSDFSLYGSKSLKVIALESGVKYVVRTISNLDPSKHYLLGLYGKSDGITYRQAYLSTGTYIITSSNATDWKFGYGKFTGRSNIVINLYANSGIGSCYYDGLFLYEIPQSTYDKIGVSLTDADVEKMFPYVDGVQHVKNPVVTVKGSNFVKDFGNWNKDLNQNAVVSITKPYTIEFKKTGSGWESYYYETETIGGITFNYKCELSVSNFTGGTGAYLEIRFYDKNGTSLLATKGSSLYANGKLSVKETSPVGTTKVRISVVVSNLVTGGTFTFSNPMVNIGYVEIPFVESNDSYLYAETTLAGIGDKKDILSFNESVGRWEKRKVWEHVTLDGSLDWSFNVDYTGFKRVRYTLPVSYISSYQEHFNVKYDGKLLKADTDGNNVSNLSDESLMLFGVGSTPHLYITISDTDSGWTEDMTPSTDLIKSYFYGWKYTGDGTTHSWVSLVDGSAPTENTVEYCSTNIAEGFTPYKLTYQLASPVVEPVTVEGDLVVNGASQVTVSSGVVVREKVVPYLHGNGVYYVNNTLVENTGTSWFKSKAKRIVTVYKGTEDDTSNWIMGTANSYGETHARIPSSDFDTTAEYTVTYEILDKHAFTTNLNEVKATYANNIRSALDDTVTKVSDMATDVSINKRSLIDLYVRIKALEGGI